MEDGKKKTVMLIVVAVCLTLAATIVFFTRSQDTKIPSFKGETVLLKCTNPDCQEVFEMDKHAYHKYVQENQNPMSLSAPPVVCPKCGKKSAYLVIKCEKCGNIFFPGEAQDIFSDRCPKCGFSKQEETRKKRAHK